MDQPTMTFVEWCKTEAGNAYMCEVLDVQSGALPGPVKLTIPPYVTEYGVSDPPPDLDHIDFR